MSIRSRHQISLSLRPCGISRSVRNHADFLMDDERAANESTYSSAARSPSPSGLISPLQLQVLRQLVEWQICHTESIKSVIDEGWGVKHKITAKAKLGEIKQKEKKAPAKTAKPKDAAAPSEEAGPSRESLEMIPLVSSLGEHSHLYASTDRKIPSTWASIGHGRLQETVLGP